MFRKGYPMDTGTLPTILVTGGSGYIAGWIIKYLLEDGHCVHATVRNKRNTEKTAHLVKLGEAHDGRLTLFEADLLRPGSFDAAAAGCDMVIHTASPFKINGIRHPVAELITPALEGTRNVLATVNATPSVKRVVLTSSCVAVLGDPIQARDLPDATVSESVWNTTASEKHHPYAYSKTLAEKEAWTIAEQQTRWTLVTLNPGFVIGPSLSKRIDGTSIQFMKDLFDGKFRSGILDMHMGFVDVRDVARAHLLAALRECASGRHLLVAETLSYLAFADRIRSRFGNRCPLPKKNVPRILAYLIGPLVGISWKMINMGWGIPFAYDNTYAQQDLGITFRPIEETAADHAAQLKDDNLLRHPHFLDR